MNSKTSSTDEKRMDTFLDFLNFGSGRALTYCRCHLIVINRLLIIDYLSPSATGGRGGSHFDQKRILEDCKSTLKSNRVTSDFTSDSSTNMSAAKKLVLIAAIVFILTTTSSDAACSKSLICCMKEEAHIGGFLAQRCGQKCVLCQTERQILARCRQKTNNQATWFKVDC